jgi:hypothetical protein
LLVQPAPVVNVKLPSDVSAIVIGALAVVVAALTLVVLYRQLGVFRSQAVLLGHQTTLLQNQEQVRAAEAAGTLYRIADDLVEEFQKANQLPGTPIKANPETHPRQMLREASRLFAPLGVSVIYRMNEVAARLDAWFETLEKYNPRPGGEEGKSTWGDIQDGREQIGITLDAAAKALPQDLRRKLGPLNSYQNMCAMPPAWFEAGEIERATPPGIGT